MRFVYRLGAPCITALLYQGNDKCETPAQVFAWGLNSYGQLGIASDINKGSPQLIEELQSENIKSVHTSGQSLSSCAITTDHRVFTWGCGLDGVLGLEETDANVLIPTELYSVQGAKKVAQGKGHMAALLNSGKVVTWGLDDCGQCGHPIANSEMNAKYYRPTNFKGGKSPQEVQLPETVVDVDCGRLFTIAVTESGKLFSWGYGNDFALGHGDRANVKSPKQVEALEGVKIVQIACGRAFALALDDQGNLWSWGSNDSGQLGQSLVEKAKPLPQKIRALKNVVQVSAGDFFAVAITSDGKAFAWGHGGDGQLGQNNTANQSTPRQILNIPEIAYAQCGGGHTALVTRQFQLLMVGRGRDGQLGRAGHRESVASYRTTPVEVEYFNRMKVIDVACGSHHTIALVQN